MTWNRVVTIHEFYDRPRGGIAYCQGRLAVYRSLWDEEADDYSLDYGVAFIDETLLPLIEEKWAIWIRWSEAFHAGETDLATHPALQMDRSRYDELSTLLESQIVLNEKDCKRFRAEFRSVPSGWNGGEVRWF